MQDSLVRLADWLAETPASALIQGTSWVIPGVQSVHLIAIAIVMSSALMVILRVLGMVMRDEPVATVTSRFFPWIWYSLIVLLVSGAILITGEPGRSLTNSLFQLKMLMLLGVIACTFTLQQPLKVDADFWDASVATRTGARLIAVLSLGLWSCIVFAGRWIAYAG